MHRDTVTRSWGPSLCHSSTTITSCCSMKMHGPMLQGSVHNSWKPKTSQFLHGQHNHQTCHPLSMFGMLWIGVYDSVFQFLPISSNFTQPLKRSQLTFHRPQSTTWSTLCEGDVLHCVRQMVVTPDTDWFSDCTKYNNQQTQIYYQCNSSPINQLVHLYSEWYIKQKMQWATAIWKWLIELFIFLFRFGNVHVVHRFLHMCFAVLTFTVTNDLNVHLNDNRLWKFLKKNMDIPNIYSPQSSHS